MFNIFAPKATFLTIRRYDKNIARLPVLTSKQNFQKPAVTNPGVSYCGGKQTWE